MNVTDAKLKIEDALATARTELAGLGADIKDELDVMENELKDGGSEVINIIGALALSAEGLTEEDTFYLSIEAKVEGGEVDETLLSEALGAFHERVAKVKDRLAAAENISEAIKEMDREIDEELEAKYREEMERTNKAVKRDLKIAIGATVAIVLIALLFVIVSNL